MRRKDKELTNLAELEQIIRLGRICQLAIQDVPAPYIVSLNYGYRDGMLYFHSAPEGHKIALLHSNPQVGFTVAIDLGIIEGERACGWSARYRSVVGHGQIEFIDSLEGKRRAMDIIMAQYADGEFDYPPDALEKTCLYRLVIAEMSGKQTRV